MCDDGPRSRKASLAPACASAAMSCSSLPRFRSQPIQRCSLSLNTRLRCSRMKRGAPGASVSSRGWRALRSRMFCIASASKASSLTARSVSASAQSVSKANWAWRSGLARWCSSRRCASAAVEALSLSMAGITTITRCSAGMPPASARRGRRAGRADSLTRRLITATSASLAGNSISTTATPVSASGVWRDSIQATSASVPSTTVPR